MSTFNVEVDIDNSAFADSGEVTRILCDLATRVEVQVVDGRVAHNGGSWPVRDANGNQVGVAWIDSTSGVDVETG